MKHPDGVEYKELGSFDAKKGIPPRVFCPIDGCASMEKHQKALEEYSKSYDYTIKSLYGKDPR